MIRKCFGGNQKEERAKKMFFEEKGVKRLF